MLRYFGIETYFENGESYRDVIEKFGIEYTVIKQIFDKFDET